jgi:hypothetical protein
LINLLKIKKRERQKDRQVNKKENFLNFLNFFIF